jgi:amino acid adenylation domain-containing protein
MSNVSTWVTSLPREQQAILAKCLNANSDFTEFKEDDLERSIPSRFEYIASKYPHRPAVSSKNRSLTYNALNENANRIARALLSTCGQSTNPIAIYMDHDCDFITAILGVLKANKTFVPLDPQDPDPRTVTMLEDSLVHLILANNATLPHLKGIATPQNSILNIDNINSAWSAQNLNLSIAPDTIAYVMYTSGSTGRPKAVMQTHRNLLQQTLVYTNMLHITPFDGLTLLHYCNNGACTPNLFGSLLNGAALYPFDVKKEGVTKLFKFLSVQNITVYHSVPALFRSLIQSLNGTEDFSNIRIVHLSGDAAANSDVELYRRHFSATCIFVHRLGSREANTVFLYLIDKNSQLHSNILPVGPAVQGKEVFLLDDDGMQVGQGKVGEIVIKSKYLSPGYWRDLDRTKEVFKTDPDGFPARTFYTGDVGRLRPDGCFEHLGRKDNRVKIRGHRVEIGEVEVTLLNHDNIKQVAIVAFDTPHGDKELVAYVVALREPVPSATELRKFLEVMLPPHMIPAAFVLVDALPFLANGKIDRNALCQRPCDRSQLNVPFVAARTPVEEVLVTIWTDAMGLNQIGIKDNFFELGGHSLLAAKIMVSVQANFQIEVPWRVLFDNPTIEQFALMITEELMKLDQQEKSNGSLTDTDSTE